MSGFINFAGNALLIGGKVVLFFMVIALIVSIINYYDARTENLKKVTPQQKSLNSATALTMIDQVIESIMREKHDLQIQFKTPFNMLKIDEDAKETATRIYESLDVNLFRNSDEYFLTPSYIERYIADTLTIKLIEMYKATNLEIAQMHVTGS